jgi:hypothetical protein
VKADGAKYTSVLNDLADLRRTSGAQSAIPSILLIPWVVLY